MVKHSGKQTFVPSDESMPSEYLIYRNLGTELPYIGSTYAQNVREALKIIFALKTGIESEGLKIDVTRLEEGVWQALVGADQYIVKRK